MSIETSPASTANKSVAASTAAGAKSQSGKGVPASVMGFGAILAAEEVPVDSAPMASEAENLLPNEPLDAVDTAQSAINLIATLPQPMALTMPDSSADLTSGANSPLQSPVVQTALPIGGAFSGGVTETGAAPSLLQPAIVQAQPSAFAGKGDGDVVAKADRFGAVTSAVTDGLPVVTDHAPQGAKVSKAGGGLVDAGKVLDTKFFAAMEAMKSMQFAKEPQFATQGAAVVATGMVELSKPEKGIVSTEAMPIAYTANAPTLGTTSYASTAVVDASSIGPEMQVAEQVSYWISQDVQNAELTLDGLGNDPVEVSIRMSGNEAQVTFRTNELQTRDLLEGATAHLKELLHSEGLVLSEVSVGTSGSGDAGNGQQRHQQGGRHFTAQHVVPEPVPARRLPTGSQGQSLDLFV